MEHTIVIASNLRKPDKNGSKHYLIECRYILTENDICKMVLNDWRRDNPSINPEREYVAEIEETRH